MPDIISFTLAYPEPEIRVFTLLQSQPFSAGLTSIAALSDPNADRILFWDDSAGAYAYLTAGSGLTIAGTTISASGGGGTVTSVSVTPANGVSGSVATATTTPAISIILGDITPASVEAVGTVTGVNLSGLNTGDQTDISGNAATATALETARTINGTSFDGTANITVAAAAGTLTGTTLASNVVTSSLTAVGTLATGAVPTTLLTGTITNAQLAGSIVYSKLSLTGAILNADLAGSIDGGKISGGTFGAVAVTNLTGTASININGTVGATTPTTGAFTTLTNTGAATNSAAGATSAPALKVSGVPFAGTGTTSFPLVYINDANATASTTLNTAGTYLGVNGDGTQDLMNLLKDGTSVYKVSSTGAVTTTATANFNGTTIGSQTVQSPAASGEFYIGVLGNGAGSGNWALKFQTDGTTRWKVSGTGHLLAETDNTYDIGASGATRPRSLYVGTNGTFGGTLSVTGTSTLTGIVACGAQMRLKGYTVATLPGSPTQGDTAFVTDSLTPVTLAIVAGGGASVVTVFYNGTNWIVQ